ncbi:MAG: glycosyltransferase [Oligoflexia bacterium]|nr:glycosyltransferase [Oligoflexia bacterium]
MVKKLSIITITYKDSQGLQTTLDSLKPLSQSDIKWEHVIVDSSPEINKAVISSLPASWPLIYKTIPAQGVYDAFNHGLGASKGEWIWLLNGGDRLKSLEALKIVLSEIQQARDIDLVLAAVALTKNGKYQYTQIPNRQLEKNILGSQKLCQQGLIYKAALFKKTGLFSTKYKIASDYEHHFRCMLSGAKTLQCADVIAEFDMSGSSANYKLAFKEFKKIHKELRSKLPLKLTLINEIYRRKDYLRVLLLKFFAQSPLAPILRPLWIAWNRGFRL